MFKLDERPTGAQLEAFRLRCVYRGRTPSRQEFCDFIGIPLKTYEGYAIESRGTLMPALTWTLTRITWDALMLAQWQQQRPKQEGETT